MVLLPSAGSDTVTFLAPWWWRMAAQRLPMMPAPVIRIRESGCTGDTALEFSVKRLKLGFSFYVSLSQPWRRHDRGSHRAPVSRLTESGRRKT